MLVKRISLHRLIIPRKTKETLNLRFWRAINPRIKTANNSQEQKDNILLSSAKFYPKLKKTNPCKSLFYPYTHYTRELLRLPTTNQRTTLAKWLQNLQMSITLLLAYIPSFSWPALFPMEAAKCCGRKLSRKDCKLKLPATRDNAAYDLGFQRGEGGAHDPVGCTESGNLRHVLGCRA